MFGNRLSSPFMQRWRRDLATAAELKMSLSRPPTSRRRRRTETDLLIVAETPTRRRGTRPFMHQAGKETPGSQDLGVRRKPTRHLQGSGSDEQPTRALRRKR